MAIQTALSNPGYYLPSAGCVSEQSGLDSNMPDICIAYQLLLECGKLVNLYDWLQVCEHVCVMICAFKLYVHIPILGTSNNDFVSLMYILSAIVVYSHRTTRAKGREKRNWRF